MWPNIMAAFLDSVPPGHAPQTNYSTGPASCFFVAFMIVGSLFTLSLFVGAITDQFNQKADSLANAGGTTDLQKEYLWVYREVTKLDVTTSTRCFVQGLFSYGEDKPENYNQQWDVRFRYHCYKLISHKYFHYAGSVLSVLSLILIASWNGNAYESYLFFFRTTDLVFSWLFLLEVALNILGLGWHQYWYFGANKIDFVLAILAMPVAIGSLAMSSFDPKIPRLNGLRALRLERLLRGELRAMAKTLKASLSVYPSIALLLTLVYLIYAIAGVALFQDAEFGEYINEQANFRTVLGTMVLLFRFTTGESLNGMMR